eukprot:CAMPEP_0183337484 /NCGR_PEP_ID=MMETSP0164_2-20130417/5107_1 /TAXON_ID=221442 /ORGANISM="Coccolithus pelagicus ssp braarudi, Strain PLY182g" /LENGTH=477 /DNA_ID=CAMNT_0025507177 /DNA_START=55 /DNA_END=1488 /DNA_ORIENTATION=-
MHPRPGTLLAKRPVAIGCVLVQVVLVIAQLINGWGHLAAPSFGWIFPFGTPFYRCVEPHELAPALAKACPSEGGAMCLSAADWDTLSDRALSPDSPSDVLEVSRGIAVAAKRGLVIAGLARNTAEHVPAWQQNAEAVLPFFNSLMVIVFENDSKDGTRETLKAWSKNAEGYAVHVVECEGSPDCKLGHGRWYTAGPQGGRKQTQLAHYRNLLLEAVLARTKGKGDFHMLVMDVDLAVSVSPLGIVHTLGVRPNAPVAAAGRFITAMTLGSIDNYYDLSAFIPSDESGSGPLVALHEAFCSHALRIASGWDRATCDTSSAFHIATVLANHRWYKRIYRVRSAYNGAFLYPLEQIRITGARYSTASTWGSAESGDGDLNEHIKFNMGLQNATAAAIGVDQGFAPGIYLNPQWSFHVSPERPPGPTGPEWKQVAKRIGANPFPFIELVLVGALIRLPIGYVTFRLLLGRERAHAKGAKAL